MLSMGCGTSKITAADEADEKNDQNGGVTHDVTIVTNSPITSLPTPNIEIHNESDEQLEIQGIYIFFITLWIFVIWLVQMIAI